MPHRDPKLLLLVNAAIAGTRAATIDVTFPPELEQRPREIATIAIKASKGDVVRWTFTDTDKAQNHSVIQVSFDDPCTPLPGGFASPVGALNNNSEFSITLDDDSALLGAAAIGGLIYLVIFIRRRQRARRESVTPLAPATVARPSGAVSQPASGPWADDSSQGRASSAPASGTSPLAMKAKALGMFRESTAWTDAGTTPRGLTSTGDARSDADGSQWQAVQQAARGAGFSPQALLASLNRVQHPDYTRGEGVGTVSEAMPPRYDG
ncbi:hypothetical protein AURDEDRAFT_166956 [Auricularia subglabra TFB-10046 SS5]|nr:hypothetical protein AURDEDRAFT_166956 [Auricularia subglabra TFB-10046 SS5]